MTDAEKELRRLAQEATPGPWEVEEDGDWDEAWCQWHRVGKLDMAGAKLNKDTRFIAAADPAAVLALLERIEALEKWQDDAVRLYEQGDRYVADHAWAEKHRREKAP